jgi:NAD-dependent deacetylase
MPLSTDALTQAAGLIAAARSVVAFTGAGISVDSGIPDFRSPGGLWERFDPMEYATIDAFHDHPDKVWSMLFEMMTIVDAARPNAGHFALAELERMDRMDAVITQNIDNLHQSAGSSRVVEYHGTSARLVCLRCRRDYPSRHFDGLKRQRPLHAPLCLDCGRVLKPDVVLFGEAIPDDAARQSAILAAHCDVMLVIGTSATVYPAAGLPVLAKQRGAKIVEINRESTPLTDALTDVVLHGSSTDVIPALVERVKDVMNQAHKE